MTVTYRKDKVENLTPDEVDANFKYLADELLKTNEALVKLNESSVAAEADGSPGAPVVTQNPYAPNPVFRGNSKTYGDFDHDLRDNENSVARHSWQSSFDVTVTIPGQYFLKVKLAQWAKAEINNDKLVRHNLHVRERDKTYHFARLTGAYYGIGEDGVVFYDFESPVGLQADIPYVFVIFQENNDLFLSEVAAERPNIPFEYSLELVAPSRIPDPLRPETWIDYRSYMVPTMKKSARGDTIYQSVQSRDDAGWSMEIPLGTCEAGKVYQVHRYNGMEAGGAVERIAIKGDGVGSTEIMTFRKPDGSTVWDFDDETTRLIGDEWVHTFTADHDGEVEMTIGDSTSSGINEFGPIRFSEFQPIHVTPEAGSQVLTAKVVTIYDITDPAGLQINGVHLDNLAAIPELVNQVVQNADGTITITQDSPETNLMVQSVSGEFTVRIG